MNTRSVIRHLVHCLSGEVSVVGELTADGTGSAEIDLEDRQNLIACNFSTEKDGAESLRSFIDASDPDHVILHLRWVVFSSKKIVWVANSCL